MAVRPGITALIPTFGEDVVAIFEQSESGDDVQILEGAHLMRATVGEDVTFYKHPLENGRSLVDHRIIQPVTIEFQIILTDDVSILGAVLALSTDFVESAGDVYTQIREVFLAGTLLSIQTRTATYRNQVIQAMPHEETSRVFDGVTISASMSEIQFETANTTFAPADETDSDTVARGKQSPLEIVGDAATNILTAATDFLGV